jgi:hypothetical protein
VGSEAEKSYLASEMKATNLELSLLGLRNVGRKAEIPYIVHDFVLLIAQYRWKMSNV